MLICNIIFNNVYVFCLYIDSQDNITGETSVLIPCNLTDEQRKIISVVKKGDRDLFINLIQNYLTSSNDLNFYDEEGWTILHHAVEEGNLKIVKLLLRFNCNINHRSNKKQTPLHRAVINGYFDISRLLIDHGSSVFYSDDENNNAFHFCAIEGHYELLKYILENHQFNLVKNLFGNTAIDLSKDNKIKDLFYNSLSKVKVLSLDNDEFYSNSIEDNKSKNIINLKKADDVNSINIDNSNCVVNINNNNNYYISAGYNSLNKESDNNKTYNEDINNKKLNLLSKNSRQKSSIKYSKTTEQSNSIFSQHRSNNNNKINIPNLTQKIYTSCSNKLSSPNNSINKKTKCSKYKNIQNTQNNKNNSSSTSSNNKKRSLYNSIKEENANILNLITENFSKDKSNSLCLGVKANSKNFTNSNNLITNNFKSSNVNKIIKKKNINYSLESNTSNNNNSINITPNHKNKLNIICSFNTSVSAFNYSKQYNMLSGSCDFNANNETSFNNNNNNTNYLIKTNHSISPLKNCDFKKSITEIQFNYNK